MPRSLDPDNYPPVFIELAEQVAAGTKITVDFPTLADAHKFIRKFTAGLTYSLKKMKDRIEERRWKDVTEEEKRWMEVLRCIRMVSWIGPEPSKEKKGAWSLTFLSKDDTEEAQAVRRALNRSPLEPRPEVPEAKHQAPAKPKSDFQAMLDRLLDIQKEVDEAGKINPPEDAKGG